eukprot:152183_1
MTITKQPSSSVCPTIKSNARLRRSRKWRDQSDNGENTNNNKTTPKRKNIRRRPSSSKKEVGDSSISCASTASMSTTSVDSCASPPTKKSNNQSSSRKGTKKKKKSTRRNCRPTPKVIFTELTHEEKSNYLAIDCEMVGIGPAGYTSRLARVSIVNY